MPVSALTDPRSEATRQRLIDTGLELFGRYGFDGVTTRQLAEAAQVNQAAIPYHFGGKEGVYLAVAKQIAANVGPQICDLQKQAESRLSAESPQSLLLDITLKLAEIAFAPEHQKSWFILLTREQFHPTAASEILYTGFMQPAHDMIGKLIARITSDEAESEDNILLAHAYLGQLIGFAIGKATLSRRLNWPLEFTPAEWQQIKATIARFSRATIAGMTFNYADSKANPAAPVR